jgi:O-acetyl-ADP-ribose deacetylase (regulator of RNase III)
MWFFSYSLIAGIGGEIKNMLENIKLILVDTNKEVTNAFIRHFHSFEMVEVHTSPFQQVPEFDCIVRPANSFGIMDGGIDKHIIDFFGTHLMKRVQQYIIENYADEQPIGTSFIIETYHKEHPYLAHTPTMRIPENIENTDHPYKAMKAMLLTVHHHNQTNDRKVYSIACSGLGTMAGNVNPDSAARQMGLAYHHVLYPMKQINWNTAKNRHSEIIQSI